MIYKNETTREGEKQEVYRVKENFFLNKVQDNEKAPCREKKSLGGSHLHIFALFPFQVKAVLYKCRKQTGANKSPWRVHVPVIFKHQVQSGGSSSHGRARGGK